jgi:glycosyltransferase involved in cell wall biosynthesis
MKIVMLSDWETQFGGAAVAASRLARSLCCAGHEVTRIVAVKDGKNYPWRIAELQPSIWGWAVHRFVPGLAWESFSRWEIRRRLRRLLEVCQPDVINIHNLHGASTSYGWPMEVVSNCAAIAPVVWTLHDMWSFTGRCAFNYECQKYLMGCDKTCPTPAEYPALAPHRIAKSWRRRSVIYQGITDITAVSPSAWLARYAQEGLWAGKRVEIIPYGLPLGMYRPIERRLAREALDIPVQGITILAAAFNFEDPRKGSDILLKALQISHTRPLTLITLGSGSMKVDLDDIRVCQLGYIDHERSKVLAYSAADVFIHPSRADNLPNTVMESIACGTPVVSFNVGGTPEMVRPGETGWLANEVTASALAATLDLVCGEIAAGGNLRNTCRAVAEAEYGDELQASRYISLFQSLFATGDKRR